MAVLTSWRRHWCCAVHRMNHSSMTNTHIGNTLAACLKVLCFWGNFITARCYAQLGNATASRPSVFDFEVLWLYRPGSGYFNSKISTRIGRLWSSSSTVPKNVNLVQGLGLHPGNFRWNRSRLRKVAVRSTTTKNAISLKQTTLGGPRTRPLYIWPNIYKTYNDIYTNFSCATRLGPSFIFGKSQQSIY